MVFINPSIIGMILKLIKKELEHIVDLQKEMIKNNTAAICDTIWTINGSAPKVNLL